MSEAGPPSPQEQAVDTANGAGITEKNTTTITTATDNSAELERIFGDDLSDVSDLPADYFEQSSDEEIVRKSSNKKPAKTKKTEGDNETALKPASQAQENLDNSENKQDFHANSDSADDSDTDADEDKKRKKVKGNLPDFRKKGADRGTKIKKTARRRQKSNDNIDVPLTAAESRIKSALDRFDSIMDGLKSQRKKEVFDEDEVEQVARKLKDGMISAWQRDVEDLSEKRPAVSKLRILPIVKEHLSKPLYHEIYMDNGVLEAMKLWLEPSDDAVLATKSIRQGVFELLNNMAVTTDHLRESKIGVVVNFLSRTELESQEMRLKWRDLMHKWVRPITKQSADYRDMDSRTLNQKQTRISTKDPTLQEGSGPNNRIPDHRTHNPEGVRYTRIPQQFSENFTIAPKSAIDMEIVREHARDRGESSYSRLSQKIRKR